jgi:hypothetical protein
MKQDKGGCLSEMKNPGITGVLCVIVCLLNLSECADEFLHFLQ